MSAVGETLATALFLSGLAACCLVLLPRTPPQIRFSVAVAGLAAWVVPWGWIHFALPSSSAAAPLVEWLGTTQAVAPLAECAIVVAPYDVEGVRAGTIGVLGPTRMNYPQALAAVAVVSNRLSDRLTEG